MGDWRKVLGTSLKEKLVCGFAFCPCPDLFALIFTLFVTFTFFDAPLLAPPFSFIEILTTICAGRV